MSSSSCLDLLTSMSKHRFTQVPPNYPLFCYCLSDGDIPIFCAEASIANTIKARRSNSGALFCNSSLSSILYKILYLNAILKIFSDIPLNFGVK